MVAAPRFGRKAALVLLLLSSLSLTFSLSIPRQHVHPSTAPSAKKSKLTTTTALQMSDGAAEVPRGGDIGEGTATIPNEVFNLVKSIVGAGVLSLPAGTNDT
jgi:hypothetical protein